MEKVLDGNHQNMIDVAEKQRKQNIKAKEAGYGTHKERVRILKWQALRYVSCVAVVVYVFFDYIVKWF